MKREILDRGLRCKKNRENDKYMVKIDKQIVFPMKILTKKVGVAKFISDDVDLKAKSIIMDNRIIL